MTNMKKNYISPFAMYIAVECNTIIAASEKIEIDGEGGEGESYDTENVSEDFDIFNYTVDYENLVFINNEDESEQIPFEITEENEIIVDSELALEAWIDEEAQVITSMQQISDGELVTVAFYDVESCLEGVEIPETMEEGTEEDLGMALLGVIFSAFDFSE